MRTLSERTYGPLVVRRFQVPDQDKPSHLLTGKSYHVVVMLPFTRERISVQLLALVFDHA